MKLQFLERLEVEQRVAFVRVVVEQMCAMGLLVEEAAKAEPEVVARQVVGVIDSRAERRSALNALRAIIGSTARIAAVVAADRLAPALAAIADKAAAGRREEASDLTDVSAR